MTKESAGVEVTCRDRCELRPLIWQCSDDKRGRFRAQALFALGLLIAGMGTLELRGGHLICSHWEAWMMAAYGRRPRAIPPYH
jgi:hypothetical protein